MKELIGKKVKIWYSYGKDIKIYSGTVQKIENNLVFLTNVKCADSLAKEKAEDQVINTASSAFIRFDIL